MPDAPLLIAYDGSEAAGRAVDQAGALFSGRDALVITVWRSLTSAAGAARVALPDEVVDEAVERLDEAAREAALELAGEGAERARAAGLEARADARACDDAVWATLIEAADGCEAAAIVVGTRGRSAVRAALLGSTSSGVINHSRRPVVVAGDDRG
jgi:nucleotide-binding universal stress UspA family protein